MLQQTQVDRVIPFYREFIRQFPDAKRLAHAPLADVLKAWQGLGYNRRAKLLWQAAQYLSEHAENLHEMVTRPFHGDFPAKRVTVRRTGIGNPKNLQKSSYGIDFVDFLERLPGVGPYTARAVAAFAFNQDVVFVETNIRTAVIHHFFPKKKVVHDADILHVLAAALPKGRAREWYSALMDYGAFLKRTGVKVNAKSAQYAKQKKFAGSAREARGAVLKALAKGEEEESQLERLFGVARKAQMHAVLLALEVEGLIQKHGKYFGLPNYRTVE